MRILGAHKRQKRTTLFLSWLLLFPLLVYGQQKVKEYKISVQQAIDLAKRNNNLVKASETELLAADADLRDAKNSAFPSVFSNGFYQRFTSLTLYNSFLGDSHAVPKRPSSDGAEVNVSAAFNIYSGGRQRSLESEQAGKKELVAVSSQEQSANIALQVVAQYLNMVRLDNQKRIIKEQVTRAETRLKNINALYNNQKVTRSDVLRAEVSLSSALLNEEQVDNDITISSQKLTVLIALPESSRAFPTDSASTPGQLADSLVTLVNDGLRNAYAIQKSASNINIQNARISGIRSNYAPSVSLFSAYGFDYPNTIFYPPVDQAYSIGFLGVKVSYNISSIYQNKNKMSAGKIRLRELNFIEQNIKDNIKQEANGLVIKYEEALRRITVTEKSIEQARANYKIVSAKYFNQLALLTDLLDADNLYQESRFSLVQAQTSGQFIYYQLLYALGKL